MILTRDKGGDGFDWLRGVIYNKGLVEGGPIEKRKNDGWVRERTERENLMVCSSFLNPNL